MPVAPASMSGLAATRQSTKAPRSSVIRRYALAGSSVLAGIAVQVALNPGPRLVVPLLMSLLAVMITAYLGGRGPALFATAANLAVNCFYLSPPQFRFVASNPADAWCLAAFAVAGIGISLLSHRLPGARHLPRVVLMLAASLFLVIVAVLVWSDLASDREAERLVDHTYQVLNASELLLSTIQDAEARQRGYLLTGDEQYLEIYRGVVSAERSAVERLRTLAGDNLVQQARLKEVERLAGIRLTRLEQGISIRREQGIGAAIEVVRTAEGARLMDQIRFLLYALETEEHRLLTQRTQAAADQAARTRWALALGTALLVALLIVAGVIIENDVGKLQSSERTLRRQADLLDKSQGAIVVWQLGGVIEYWNHGAEELYGIGREKAVGSTHNELLHPIHPLGISAIEERLVRDGEWRGELTHVLGGREIIVESRMTLVIEPDGRKTVLKTNRDITEEKRAQEEIRQLNRELEQRVQDRTAQLEASNKELEAFAYSVSHDLRAPLRGIDGWSLALLEEYGSQFDQNAHQYLERVRAETQRMGNLIDDLLKLSRLTRAELRYESVDLSALSLAIARRLQEAEPNRSIDFAIQEGLAGIADARLLEIVLVNLLSNAVKFTGPRPRARIEFGQTRRHNELAFYVRDNGVGFDMAYASTLFGAFQRLHRYTEFPGTGIGLATAQRVLRRHGGKIWADAKPDQGATFYFTIEPAVVWNPEVSAKIV
jgi:PAS domain S-box-containing protein